MIQAWERSYLSTLHRLRSLQKEGHWRGNRTGIRTAGGFGLQLDVPLNNYSFPAMVTKSIHMRSIIAELLWFLRGDTNVAFLRENGCTIWDEWATALGDLGPVYGAQWRTWVTPNGEIIDQIHKLIEDLRERPDSRRMIVSAWNPAVLPLDKLSPRENAEMGRQALAPCHMLFQAYVEPLTLADRVQAAQGLVPDAVSQDLMKLSSAAVKDVLDNYLVPTRGLRLRVDQRSADWFLGVPFNIPSYALLAHLLCQQVDDLTPVGLCMQFGDYHLYENQADAADEQLSRFDALHGLRSEDYPAPQILQYGQLQLDGRMRNQPVHALDPDEIKLVNYQAWGKIAAPVAV